MVRMPTGQGARRNLTREMCIMVGFMKSYICNKESCIRNRTPSLLTHSFSNQQR